MRTKSWLVQKLEEYATVAFPKLFFLRYFEDFFDVFTGAKNIKKS